MGPLRMAYVTMRGKHKTKAKVVVLVVWLFAAIYIYGMFTLGLDIDLVDALVLIYRLTYVKRFASYFIILGVF